MCIKRKEFPAPPPLFPTYAEAQVVPAETVKRKSLLSDERLTELIRLAAIIALVVLSSMIQITIYVYF